jgi:3'(2'), 5'-bisphosphate nucleotidase
MVSTAVERGDAALAKLRAVALRAGEAILAHYGEGAPSVAKADGSPLTLADSAAQSVIIDDLHAWDASIPIISEEADAASFEERRDWPRFWLVDPLDGTKEFLSHNGEFTVNIALIDGGEPVMGVVYAPALGLLYTAARGCGAWRQEGDSAPVRIFHVPPAPGQPLVVIESRSHPSPELEAFLATIPVRERIGVGSSLKFCRVAEGAADIYPRLGPTMEWDVAAGDCIFRNATMHGEHPSPLTYNKPDLRNPSFVIGGMQRSADLFVRH